MKLGKTNYLLVMRREGYPVVTMVCTRSAYRRADGSVYAIDGNGKRFTLTPCEPAGNSTWPYQYKHDPIGEGVGDEGG